MAVTAVQDVALGTPGGATSRVFALPAAPTAGNLLVFTLAGDKNTGASTLAGFTLIYELLAANVSLYYYWKISDGSETSITPSWATPSSSGSFGRYAEYDDPAVSVGEWLVSGQASNPSDNNNYTSWSTGTTGTLADDGLAVAMMAIDSASSVVTGTTAWTNSYSIVWTTPSDFGGSANGASLHVADKQVTAGGTTESTFSYTASDINRDQIAGAVAVFAKVSNDFALSSRGAAAVHGHAAYGFALTPHARGSAAAHGSSQYVQNIRAGTYGTVAAHGYAQVLHSVTLAATGHTAAHGRAPLVAGPNDVTRAAHGALGAHGEAQIIQTFPAPVPAARSYRITTARRVYEIARGNAVGLTKTFLADESDDLDYRYDWSRVLEEGETIVDSVIEAPDGITVHDQVCGAETTDVWFSGGSVGGTYLIPNRITTSAGRVYERNIELKVRDR